MVHNDRVWKGFLSEQIMINIPYLPTVIMVCLSPHCRNTINHPGNVLKYFSAACRLLPEQCRCVVVQPCWGCSCSHVQGLVQMCQPNRLVNTWRPGVSAYRLIKPMGSRCVNHRLVKTMVSRVVYLWARWGQYGVQCCVPISILLWVHLNVVHYPHSLSALIFICQCCSKSNTLWCTNLKLPSRLPPRLLPAINIQLWTLNSSRLANIKSYKSYKNFKMTPLMQARWKMRRLWLSLAT